MKLKKKIQLIKNILFDNFDEDDLSEQGVFITKPTPPPTTIHGVYIRPITIKNDKSTCDYCGKNHGGVDLYVCHYCGWHFCDKCRLPENHMCGGKLKSPLKGGVECYGKVYGK